MHFRLMAVVMAAVLAFGGERSEAETALAKAPLAEVPTTDDLIIYRAHAEPTAWSSTIKIDGRKIASLPNRHYTSVNVAPGAHTVTVSWPFMAGQSEASMDINIEGNEMHFIEVLGTYRFAGLGPTPHTIYIRKGSGVAESTPEYARQVIAACCKFEPSK